MKKLVATVTVITGLFAGSASAGSLLWASMNEAQTAYVPFTDNNNATFTGYAYLFLLTGQGATVSWDGSSWNLNSAQQLAFSAAGSLEATPGTWGNGDGQALADVLISPTAYYQVILTTATGNALLTGVTSGNGYWAPTAARQIGGYNDIEGLNRTGSLTWQTTSASWAPVAAVPEPATMALFGLGGLALVIRRKMRKEA